jgi:hypothetical protein
LAKIVVHIDDWDLQPIGLIPQLQDRSDDGLGRGHQGLRAAIGKVVDHVDDQQTNAARRWPIDACGVICVLVHGIATRRRPGG